MKEMEGHVTIRSDKNFIETGENSVRSNSNLGALKNVVQREVEMI